MLKDDDYGIECLKRLNGHKYLAIGNHDTTARIDKYRVANIFADIEYGYRMKAGKFSVWAQHYPAMMGNYKDKNPVICLAGHTHSPDRFENMEYGCYNVSLDAHDCYPVSIDKILEDIKKYRQHNPIAEYTDKSPYCKSCQQYDFCETRRNHELVCPGFVKRS